MMDLISFPSTSRVWIYGGDRILPDEIIPFINQEITDFTKKWTSHGILLKTTGGLMHNSMLILIADESKKDTSGCSIDSSVQFIRELGNKYGIDFFNRLVFHYLKNDQPYTIRASELAGAIESGEITDSTLFFDNLVDTKKKFQEEWIKPLRDSWHQKFA
jgi:hypothetical protein